MCFICFENELENKYSLTKLKDQKLFIKNCICDGCIHNECLTKWYNIKPVCPICRKFMVEIVYLPSCNRYLDHFSFFIEYYIINNHQSNNIFIIITKSSFFYYVRLLLSILFIIIQFIIYYFFFFFCIFCFLLYIICYYYLELQSNYT